MIQCDNKIFGTTINGKKLTPYGNEISYSKMEELNDNDYTICKYYDENDKEIKTEWFGNGYMQLEFRDYSLSICYVYDRDKNAMILKSDSWLEYDGAIIMNDGSLYCKSDEDNVFMIAIGDHKNDGNNDIQYIYNNEGNLSKVVDRNGINGIIDYEYDQNNNIVSSKLSVNTSDGYVEYELDSQDNINKITIIQNDDRLEIEYKDGNIYSIK